MKFSDMANIPKRQYESAKRENMESPWQRTRNGYYDRTERKWVRFHPDPELADVLKRHFKGVLSHDAYWLLHTVISTPDRRFDSGDAERVLNIKYQQVCDACQDLSIAGLIYETNYVYLAFDLRDASAVAQAVDKAKRWYAELGEARKAGNDRRLRGQRRHQRFQELAAQQAARRA